MNALRQLAGDVLVPILVVACDDTITMLGIAPIWRSCIRHPSINTASESLTENIRTAGHCDDDPLAA